VDDTPVDELRERVLALELKTSRLARRANVALSLAALSSVLCAMLIMGDLPRRFPSVINTSSLVTESLRVRRPGANSEVLVGINEGGEAVISVLNAYGTDTLSLGNSRGGQPVLRYRDRSGVLRVMFGLVSDLGDTSSSLNFFDRSGQNRLSLCVAPDGLPQIEESGTSGLIRMGMFMTADDSARIELVSENKTQGIRIDAPKNAESRIDTIGRRPNQGQPPDGKAGAETSERKPECR
jgi:hypothetical protein